MTIRTAIETDMPALNAIYSDAVLTTEATCFFDPPSDKERFAWWQAHQVPQCPILVAEDADGILGYASLSWWVLGPVYAHTVELSVYVAQDARGRGIGKALAHAILKTAQDVGHHVVIARIWAGNAASVALFTGLGFAATGTLREVGYRNGQWEDCIVTQKTLSPYEKR